MVMLCAITLCMLACVQCLEHSSNVKHNAISQQVALSKINNEGSDTITKERMTKRAVGQATAKGLYALQKLLNDAKNVKTRSNSFRRYEKMGNADTALRDFYSVYPTNIQRKANFRFGTIQQLRDGSVITGQVGNKRLILLTSGDKRSRGRPVLEIRTAIEPVYDKIIYKPKTESSNSTVQTMKESTTVTAFSEKLSLFQRNTACGQLKMDTSFGLGVCVFSLCILVAAHCSETEHDDITYYHMEGDHHIQEQKIMTRSVNPAVAKGMAAMEKLLSGAKSMRVTSTRFRKYEKQGDANTALKDFYSVQPANVQRKSAFSFGRGSIGDNSIIGQVGNKRLILRLSGDRLSTRYPVLEIRTATDPVFDRVVYKKSASD